MAPALAAGNAVVIKPDTRTPLTGGLMIARVFAEAGLPKDLLQVLPGDAEADEALVIDPLVPMIAFTGPPAVGRRLGELAGKHLKKVALWALRCKVRVSWGVVGHQGSTWASVSGLTLGEGQDIPFSPFLHR